MNSYRGNKVSLVRLLTFVCFFQFSGIANGYTYSSLQSLSAIDSVSLTFSCLKRAARSVDLGLCRSTLRGMMGPILLVSRERTRLPVSPSIAQPHRLPSRALAQGIQVKFTPILVEKQASYLKKDHQELFSGRGRLMAFLVKPVRAGRFYPALSLIWIAAIIGICAARRLSFAPRTVADDPFRAFVPAGPSNFDRPVPAVFLRLSEEDPA